MWGITIRASETAEQYWRLVDEASRFEAEPSMRQLGYEPHITFATYAEVGKDELRAALSVFVGQEAITLRFGGISTFDVEPMVLWLRPDHDARLVELHRRIHAVLGEARCGAYYRTDLWQPHCTLATLVRAGMRDAALAFAAKPITPFCLTFEVADAIFWPPPRPISSQKLVTASLRESTGGSGRGQQECLDTPTP